MLHLFGGPELTAREGDPPNLSPMSLLLLSVLALEGDDGIPRERLKNLLWTRGTDDELSHRLSQLVYMTRKRLGEHSDALVGGDPLRLDGGVVDSDLVSAPEVLRPSSLGETAKTISQGLLPRCTHEEIQPLAKRTQEELLQNLKLECLRRYEASLNAADWNGVLLAVRALRIIQPNEESILRKEVTALLALERQEEARYVCAEFEAQWLADDPASQDSTVSNEVLRDIRAMAKGARGNFFNSYSSASAPTPLFGRSEELATLRAILSGDTSAEHCFLHVTGATGTGKSRLLEEAFTYHVASGGMVLKSICRPMETSTPLSSLARALEDHIVEDAMEELEPQWQSVISSLLTSHDIKGISRQETDVGTGHLLEALHLLFRCLVHHGLTSVWLDDFQWADPATLIVLDDLTRRTDLRSIHWVLSSSHPTERHAEEIHFRNFFAMERERYYEIQLGPLSQDASKALTREFIGKEPDDAFCDQIIAASGGIPKLLVLALSGGFAELTSPISKTLHGRLLELIRMRMCRMPDMHQQMLIALATVGQPVSIRCLQVCLKLDEANLASGLTALASSGWVVREAEGFTIATNLRGLVSETIPVGEQSLYHQRFANWLLAQRDHGLRCLAATHLLKAGDREGSIDLALSVAEEASARGTGIAIAPILADLTAQMHPSETRMRLEVLNGRLLMEGCDPVRAATAYGQAFQSAVKLGVPRPHILDILVSRLEAEAADNEAAHWSLLERAWALFRECLDAGSYLLAARVLGVSGRLAATVNDPSTSTRVIDLASRLKEEEDLELGERAALLLVECMQLAWGTSRSGSAAVQKVFDLAQASPGLPLLVRAYGWKLIEHYHKGELNTTNGRRTRQSSSEIISNTTDLFLRFSLPYNLGVWYLDTCDYPSSRLSFEEAEALIGGAAAQHLRMKIHFAMGDLALHEGAFAQAKTRFQLCRDLLPARKFNPMSAVASSGLALAELKLGNRKAAEEIFAGIDQDLSGWYGDSSLYYWARLEFAQKRSTPSILRALDGQVAELRLRSVPWALRLSLVANQFRVRKSLPPNRQQLELLLGEVSDLMIGPIRGRLLALLA